MSGESKKEEFRKYLERSGVIDALTKVLCPTPASSQPRTLPHRHHFREMPAAFTLYQLGGPEGQPRQRTAPQIEKGV